jgi:hypothetical protein
MNDTSLPLNIVEVDLTEPSPSCFLPGTNLQYAWDSTSLGYFKTCRRLYYYQMIEGWVPKDESVHLLFGNAYHSALEEYDRQKFAGASHTDAMRHAVAHALLLGKEWNWSRDTKAGRYKNVDTLLSLVVDYLDKHKDDKAQTLALEDGRPAVELSFRFELDYGPRGIVTDTVPTDRGDIEIVSQQPYLLCGHLDRVVTFSDTLFVMDRKTTTWTISSSWFDQWSPSNQMSLYTLASQIILGSPVKGVIIDAAQILLEKPNYFERGFTYRTPDQLEEWSTDLSYWLALAESYAEANYWPMNDTACDKFGGCKFRDICSSSPHVREAKLRGAFVQQELDSRWNPMKPRG